MTNFSGPKKHFSQNFLKVPYYAQKIADSVPADKNDSVVEIGPGLGDLSVYLQKKFNNLMLIEMDRELIPHLNKRLERNVKIFNEDAVKFDYSQLGYVDIVGNLPYASASYIIKSTLMNAPQTKSVTFMVQKEVAERIVAKPGNKTIGFLSILCRFFGETKLLFKVPSGAFFPKPKIDSAVFSITIDRNIESKLTKNKWGDFFKFVSTGYSMRRKNLPKVLSSLHSKEKTQQILSDMGKTKMARAEELSVDEWLNLYKCMENFS